MFGSRGASTSRRRRISLLLLLSVLLLASTSVYAGPDATSFAPDERLVESLLLKPLTDGRVLANFEFSLSSSSSSDASFHLLPRALMQPIQRFGVEEVHLSLSSGRWRYNSWGSPITTLKSRNSYDAQGDTSTRQAKLKLGEEMVGTGAELVAVFQEQEAADEKWKGLTSSLAGLFCASLDALDEKHTVQPHAAYSPSPNSATLHALLPTEGVCTENLTPFLKLLPCKNSAGLATLLNPLALFSANFQGLAIHVVKAEAGGWEAKLTFTSVFAPAVTRDISIRDWSISSLFRRRVEKACPLADKSIVRILKPNDPQGTSKYEVSPLPAIPNCARPGEKSWRKELLPILGEEDEVTDELAFAGLLAWETEAEEAEYEERLQRRWSHYLEHADGEYIYDVASVLSSTTATSGCKAVATPEGTKALDVAMKWPHETRFSYPATNSSSTISVDRTFLGSGQETTTLQVTLTNTDPRLVQRVLWFETLGYFVKPYLHTLTHTTSFLDASSVSEDELLQTVADFESPIEALSYQPTTGDKLGGGGKKPFAIEGIIRLPASSQVVLRMELRKTFVPYSQHPPDAHRGFDVAPSIVFPLAPVDPREALLSRRHHSTKRITHTTASVSPPSSLQDRLVQWLDSYASQPQDEKISKGHGGAIKLSQSQTRIYTLPRLVELATPDFSFVYTNIIFTSTVVALFFGSTLNTLLRSFTDFVL